MPIKTVPFRTATGCNLIGGYCPFFSIPTNNSIQTIVHRLILLGLIAYPPKKNKHLFFFGGQCATRDCRKRHRCKSYLSDDLQSELIWSSRTPYTTNKKTVPFGTVFLFGRRVEARTPDPLIKSQLLYQLSYAPLKRSCF